MLNISLNIPASFYEEEMRDGYLVSSEMKKVWAVELDLLSVFAELCKKHDLKWFVHAGTMLGAVRHQGFIPWDDDIDVVMPRADYERLCKVAPSELSYPYFYQNEETDKFFARSFSRLRNCLTTAIQENEKDLKLPYNQGIFIDVFPYDNVPTEPEFSSFIEELRKNDGARTLCQTAYFYRPKKGRGVGKRVKYLIKHLYYKYFDPKHGDYKGALEKRLKVVIRYNSVDTECVAELIISPLNRHIWKKEWVDSLVYMPFEMLQVPVPSHYEECLCASFGENWCTPIQQHTMHGGVFFDADKPYTDYLSINK